MDDEKPKLKLMEKKLPVPERGFIGIDRKMMQVSDEDTEENRLLFLVVDPPKFGYLERNG